MRLLAFVPFVLVFGLRAEATFARPYDATYGRKLLDEIRQKREYRDEARATQRKQRRVAVVAVVNESDDPEASKQVLLRFLHHLNDGRWHLLDPETTLARVDAEGFQSLGSRRRLAYLSRILDADRLVRIEVKTLQISNKRREFAELVQTGHYSCSDDEFAEVHLRMIVYEARSNDVVLRREDRQYSEYTYLAGTTHRDRILSELLDQTVANLLVGF